MDKSVSDRHPQSVLGVDPVSGTRHKFLLLDAIRGVAAILVAFRHVPVSLLDFQSESFLAVDLFFCLSGFVIAYSYEDRLKHGLSIGRFMAMRVIRLWPLYIIGTLAGIATLLGRYHASYHQHGLPQHFGLDLVLNLFFLPAILQNKYAPGIFPFDAPGWSLFYELVANALYAWLLTRRWARGTVLGLIAVASAIVIVIRAAGGNGQLDLGWLPPGMYIGFARVGYSFFVGVLLFRLFRSHYIAPARIRPSHSIAIAILAVTALTLGKTVSTVGNPMIYESCMMLFVFPMVVYVAAQISLSGRWARIASVLGAVSYPLYILHAPSMFPLYVIGLVYRTDQSLRWVFPVLPFLMVLALFPICLWMERYFDEPVRRKMILWLKRSSA